MGKLTKMTWRQLDGEVVAFMIRVRPQDQIEFRSLAIELRVSQGVLFQMLMVCWNDMKLSEALAREVK